nr:DUF6174 domain-containing protein [Pseudofrankia asymbiotica]
MNDLIAITNDPDIDEVSVEWRRGDAYPTRVVTDPVRQSTDDEVTYTVSNVTIG